MDGGRKGSREGSGDGRDRWWPAGATTRALSERLQIAVPRMGNIRAQVRWCLPGAAGTRFLTESDF